jgi:hypothetical protein
MHSRSGRRVLFCGHLDAPAVRRALTKMAVLNDDLVDAERWTPRRAPHLLPSRAARRAGFRLVLRPADRRNRSLHRSCVSAFAATPVPSQA